MSNRFTVTIEEDEFGEIILPIHSEISVKNLDGM